MLQAIAAPLLRIMIREMIKYAITQLQKSLLRAAARSMLKTTRVRVRGITWDVRRLERARERATRNGLMRCGAFVRRTARSSMRKRKNGVSQPGQPPFAKKGLLRDLLLFAYDPSTESCVVGPTRINRSTVSGVHEFGGHLKVRKKSVRYQARPFMAPALRAELPKFADQFKGTFHD